MTLHDVTELMFCLWQLCINNHLTSDNVRTCNTRGMYGLSAKKNCPVNSFETRGRLQLESGRSLGMYYSSMLLFNLFSFNLFFFLSPFARFGVWPLGGRSTAIQLQKGGVWILASTPLDAETKTSLDKLGPVKYFFRCPWKPNHGILTTQ